MPKGTSIVVLKQCLLENTDEVKSPLAQSETRNFREMGIIASSAVVTTQ